jgi:hypothetical protein
VSGSPTVPACPLTPGTGWLADYYFILLLGWLVDELSGERFSYCPGLPTCAGDLTASCFIFHSTTRLAGGGAVW